MVSTRIAQRIEYTDYRALMMMHRDRIYVSGHALVRFSEKQRNIYKDENLVKTLTQEHPRLAGLQENGRYTAFFRRNT